MSSENPPQHEGRPLNQDNVRSRIWRPAFEGVGVRYLDMYSMRHSFASLLRYTGVQEFVAARLMGHSKSCIVDKTYAHIMPSSLWGTGKQVADRVFGKLTVIDGGKRDVRHPLDDSPAEPPAGIEVAI